MDLTVMNALTELAEHGSWQYQPAAAVARGQRLGGVGVSQALLPLAIYTPSKAHAYRGHGRQEMHVLPATFTVTHLVVKTGKFRAEPAAHPNVRSPGGSRSCSFVAQQSGS